MKTIHAKIQALSAELKTLDDVDEKLIQDSGALAAAETALMKNSVPEASLGDDVDVDPAEKYFLVVAEIQRAIAELLEVRETKATRLDVLLNELQTTKNMRHSQSLMAEKLLKKADEEKRKKVREKSDEAAESRKLVKLDAEIRATKLVYKELKAFLSEILVASKSDEDEDGDSALASLLQELWNAFWSGNGNRGLKISHLDFDVSSVDLELLFGHGIIERIDDDEFRFVDFTRY